MPYLPVELDAMNKAPHVARGAGVTDDGAVAGLVRMWAECFRSQNPNVTSGQLAGYFGCPDTGRLERALESFGFLELGDAGQHRIRGSKRLLKVHDDRAKGGKATAAKLKRGPGGNFTRGPQDFTPGPQTPVSAGAQLVTQPAAAGVQLVAEPALTPNTKHHSPITKKLLRDKPAEREPDPRFAPLKALLEADYRQLIGEDWRFDGSDAKSLASLLKKAESPEIRVRFIRALQAQFHSCRRVRELEAKWGHHAEASAAAPKQMALQTRPPPKPPPRDTGTPLGKLVAALEESGWDYQAIERVARASLHPNGMTRPPGLVPRDRYDSEFLAEYARNLLDQFGIELEPTEEAAYAG